MSRTLYIVPSSAAVDAFNRRLLEETGIVFGTSALTLRMLAEAVFAAVEQSRRPISSAGRKLLLGKIVQERYRDGTGEYASLCNFPGFISALDSVFTELKQALAEPQTFLPIVRRLPGNGRLPELAELYLEYEKSLSARVLLDHQDKELAALCHLRNGGNLPPLFDGVAAIRCTGIYDLSPLQLALLAELSRRLTVEIALPWNPRRESLYAYVATTADAIEALDNAELQLDPVFAEPAGRFLTPLLAAVFDGQEWPPELSSAMALIAAPGPYRECEEIGRRIRQLLEAGTDPSTVAVAFRDLQGYGPMLEDVCRRFRIPVSYRRGAPLSTSPLVCACLAPFAVVGSRFAREELLRLIKSSYLDGSRFGVPADTFETVLLAAGYRDETAGSIEKVLGKRIARQRKLGRGTDREEAVRRSLETLVRQLHPFGERGTLRQFTLLLEGFIERHHLYRKGIAAADPLTLKRDASAITLFRQVLHDLEQDMRTLGMADEPLEPADFVKLVQQGMEEICLAGERGAGVAILNFHDARGLSFDHLFIGGLNEGTSPMNHEGHPLFKDAEKLLFRRLSGTRLFRTAREKGEEEQLLFYLALGCAGRSLTLAYSYINGQGNQMLRSPFLDELLTKIPLEEERIPVNRVTVEPADCLEREELLNSMAARRAFLLPQEGIHHLGESLTAIQSAFLMEGDRERFFEAEEKTVRRTHATPHTGKLQREDILAELEAHYSSPSGSRFAPTALEEYGCCPFSFFLRRVLKLSPLDKPEMELAAREEGSLVHEILCSFFLRLQGEGRLPLADSPDCRAVLHDVAELAFRRWEDERHVGQPLLWEIEKERLLVLLEQLVKIESDDHSGFVPVLFEHLFEDFRVEDEDGSGIVLSGKIDRVDATADGGALRVVDYKMGGDVAKYRALLKKENLGRTSFQMPVYLLAASRNAANGANESDIRLNAMYWLLRRLCVLDKDFSGGKEDFNGFFAIDPKERQGLGQDNFLNRVCAVVRAIKSGDFTITPQECHYCDFGSICRYVTVGLREDACDSNESLSS